MLTSSTHPEQKELPLWQYLTFWSDKSAIMAFYSLAVQKKKYITPIFINNCLPVFLKSVLSLIGCSSNLLSLKLSTFICLGEPPQRAGSF